MWNRIVALCAMSLLASTGVTYAQKVYGPGVSDIEIKLGQTLPLSGPVSAASTSGRAMMAYLDMVNASGGINGRQIKLVALDDGFSPPKTMEHTRKLVEQENVLAIVGSLGTPTNAVIQQYLNRKQVPQILIISGAGKFNNPTEYPFTVPFYSPYPTEAASYAKYILKNKPDAKIGVLYQNDDFGKDFLAGFKTGLGPAAGKLIVKEVTYETSDPTVDSQVISLQASGADTLLTFATQKFAALSIRKTYDIGWRPLHIIPQVASPIGSVLSKAGLEKSIGLITGLTIKDPTVPPGTDREVDTYIAFLKKWYPTSDPTDTSMVWGYLNGQLITKIIERCGDNLTRENLLKQTVAIKNPPLQMLIDGVTVSYAPNDYVGIHQVQLARFNGTSWVPFGNVLDSR